MPNPFHDFDWSLKSIGKIFGVFILGVVGLAIVVGIISFAFRTIVSPFTSNVGAYGRGGGDGMMELADYSSQNFSKASFSNILPPIIDDGEIIDATAEDYEVKSYSAHYQPNDKTEICAKIFDLKADREIVFSNSNESERSCDFTFEVPNSRTEEVLAILKNLDPENLSANIHTIQKSVERTSDQLEILTKKLAQTESTLVEAQKAYEDLMKLATNSRDVENLTQLITLKIDAIEQLAQKRISTNQEIQQVQNSRAEQLRRIANTTFNVSVYEQKFIDWKNIANDWKNEIRNFVDNLNDLTQFVSVKLVSFVLYSAAAMLYIAVVFGFLKLIWFVGKKVWKFGA
jgi:hypothetical protein